MDSARAVERLTESVLENQFLDGSSDFKDQISQLFEKEATLERTQDQTMEWV